MIGEGILAHEDTCETRRYTFRKDERVLTGMMFKTACGIWLTCCDDDPERQMGSWRFDCEDDRPTCPACVQASPYAYPRMLLVVRGGLGIPQIVCVGDDEWIGVFGIGKGKIVNPEGKTVLHVCQEGDIFEDLSMEIRGGALVRLA